MIRVIDAHSLLVFLEREPGFEKIETLFAEAIDKDTNLLMTSVNFGEVYYIVLRECGKEKVSEVERVIKTLPIEIVDVDINVSIEAAEFKATKKMSYADCFSAALTKLHKGELVTGDPEFKTVEKEIKILWI